MSHHQRKELIRCAESGHATRIRRLLDAGADTEFVANSGMSPPNDGLLCWSHRCRVHAVGCGGIVQSSTTFSDPWYNEQHTHIELGHCLLRAGCLADAQRVFDRKPKRVAQYKSISQWIANGDTARIAALHDDWIATGRTQIEALPSLE